MNRETVKREWFGAVRSAADSSGKKLREESALTPVQAVKLDILLRQYLCDGLADHISESEKVSAEEADSGRAHIYTQVTEIALACGLLLKKNMETAMFLFECTKGVRMESWFSALLKKILSEAGSEEAAQALMAEMDKDITAFSEKRKALRQPKKSSSDDEPPPWMDEFEYIDWVITH